MALATNIPRVNVDPCVIQNQREDYSNKYSLIGNKKTTVTIPGYMFKLYLFKWLQTLWHKKDTRGNWPFRCSVIWFWPNTSYHKSVLSIGLFEPIQSNRCIINSSQCCPRTQSIIIVKSWYLINYSTLKHNPTEFSYKYLDWFSQSMWWGNNVFCSQPL